MTEELEQLKIKDSWDHITIEDFMRIEEVNSSPNINSLEKMILILSILSGKPDSYFNKYRVPDITKLFDKMDFLKKAPEGNIRETYTIGEKEYSLISNIANLSTGQFIDLDHFTKEANGALDNLHIICSIFLLPKIKKTFVQKCVEKLGLKKYRDNENYMETPIEITSENIYKNMLYKNAHAICVFFCIVGQVYTKITKDYLVKTTKSQIQQVSKKLKNLSTEDKTVKRTLNKIAEKVDSLQDGAGLFA